MSARHGRRSRRHCCSWRAARRRDAARHGRPGRGRRARRGPSPARRHHAGARASARSRGWATCRTPRSSTRATGATPTCSGATAASPRWTCCAGASSGAWCRPATRIGGAISQDGTLVAVANYTPGGVRLFDADTLELLADIPATYGADGQRAKVVGTRGRARRSRFAFSLFEAGEIWIADAVDAARAAGHRSFANIGRQPYDALITPDGRHYIAGLFGEDGLALLDLWHPERGRAAHARRLRPRRGAAARLQDAASARLGGGRTLAFLPGDRPPRGAGGRHAHLARGRRASPSPASRCS